MAGEAGGVTGKPLVIGLDLGGTSLKGGAVGPGGEVVATAHRATGDGNDRAEIVGRLVELVEELWVGEIGAIGVGCAGRIDTPGGRVVQAANLPGLDGLDLAGLLAERFAVPVTLNNDANTAAIGEGWRGAAQGVNDFLLLVLGTGVGGAIVGGGRLYCGATGAAGELGHLVLHPGGTPCTCGGRGCLEQYVSGPALARRYGEARRAAPGAAEEEASGHQPSAREVFEAADAGEPLARQVVHDFCADLATGLASLQAALDPKLVVLAGGLLGSRDLWWPALETALQEHSPLPVRVRPAALGNLAGVVGAARLAWQMGGEPGQGFFSRGNRQE